MRNECIGSSGSTTFGAAVGAVFAAALAMGFEVARGVTVAVGVATVAGGVGTSRPASTGSVSMTDAAGGSSVELGDGAAIAGDDARGPESA